MAPAPITGVTLTVRLTPHANCDAIDAIGHDPGGYHLKARVRAVPEDGKANAALEKLIASWLGVSKSCVKLSGGGRSRNKRVFVTGDPDDLTARLADRITAFDGD